MERVLGIGGVFVRARNPEGLAAWYSAILGIDLVPSDYETPPWRQTAGTCVFAPFDENTTYFPLGQQMMLNFRVRDLDAMIGQLTASGIEVTPDPENPHPNGRFAWAHDPEGNRFELWEPAGETYS
ncbi:MAG: VOC family protein [Pseudomonadota bacterium]